MTDRALLFEDFVLDSDRRELLRGGVPVALGPQVFDLLLYLVQRRGRVVSKDELIQTVWKGRIVSDSTLTSHVNAVRKALGDTGKEQRLIRTFSKKGIRFVGEIRQEAAAASLPVRAVAPAVPPGRPAIAVMPFANMGGDPEQEYFVDGITEDVITALARFRAFMVIARNSTFEYKGRNVSVKQIGRDLGVHYVLEGSVRRAGSRLRITAQLIETASEMHVWAERYDREYADIFAIQDDLSRRIAAVIEPELRRHEQHQAASKPPASLEAWDCLNRGLFHVYKFNREDNATAQAFFRRAIELDPNFSRAYTSLAYTYQQEVLHAYTSDRAKSIEQHISYARRGVQLDEADSYAHLMLSFGYRWARQHDLCLAEAYKAHDCNPNDAWSLAMVGLALDVAGHHREGAADMERAMALNPRDPHVRYYTALISRAYLVARDYTTAELWAQSAIEHDPENPRSYLLLAAALGHLGRTAEACAALADGERLRPGFALTWLAGREYRDEADNDHVADGLRKAGLQLT